MRTSFRLDGMVGVGGGWRTLRLRLLHLLPPATSAVYLPYSSVVSSVGSACAYLLLRGCRCVAGSHLLAWLRLRLMDLSSAVNGLGLCLDLATARFITACSAHASHSAGSHFLLGCLWYVLVLLRCGRSLPGRSVTITQVVYLSGSAHYHCPALRLDRATIFCALRRTPALRIPFGLHQPAPHAAHHCTAHTRHLLPPYRLDASHCLPLCCAATTLRLRFCHTCTLCRPCALPLDPFKSPARSSCFRFPGRLQRGVPFRFSSCLHCVHTWAGLRSSTTLCISYCTCALFGVVVPFAFGSLHCGLPPWCRSRYRCLHRTLVLSTYGWTSFHRSLVAGVSLQPLPVAAVCMRSGLHLFQFTAWIWSVRSDNPDPIGDVPSTFCLSSFALRYTAVLCSPSSGGMVGSLIATLPFRFGLYIHFLHT